MPTVNVPVVSPATNHVTIVMPMTFSDVSLEQGTDVGLFGLSGEQLNGFVLELGTAIGATDFFNSDTSECLIEYRQLYDAEAVDPKNQLEAQSADSVNSVWTNDVQYTAVATDLHSRLINSTENSGNGVAFDIGEGTNNTGDYIADRVKFTHRQSLGDFIVEWIAYRVFGHPQATAPISNDTVIIAEVNAQPGNRNDANFAGGANSYANPLKAPLTGSIAHRLLTKLYKASGANLRTIVEQVLSQAPERFKDEDSKVNVADADNSGYLTAGWQPLEFYGGDVIYFKIQVGDFDRFVMATAGMDTSVLGLKAPDLLAKGGDFYLKVTLN